MKTASISYTVMEVETGKTVAGHQSDHSLSPASSLKVVTTATALAILGRGYRFKTELQHDGHIDDQGVLHGNIYIKGYGDPTLGDDSLNGNAGYETIMGQFADAIQAAGIKVLRGKIIGDGSYFARQSTPPSWQWNDMGNYYGAGVSGLNINANQYVLTFRQIPKIGAQPRFLHTVPELYNTHFVNEVTSAAKGSGDQCYIYGAPFQHTRFLRGTIPAGTGEFRVKGSLPEPAFTAAALLLLEMEKRGIITRQEASSLFMEEITGGVPRGERQTIHTHESLSLFEIAKAANEKSVNLYCEAMLRMIGVRRKKEGSWEKGAEAVEEFWSARGVDMDGFFMEDGCGLSVRNGITTKQLASMLRKIKVDESLGFDFMRTLPIGGKTGTLKGMFRGTPAEGRIFAKTGSMDRIRSYSGYIKTTSGKLLSFAIIVNQYHCESGAARRKLEAWMKSWVNR